MKNQLEFTVNKRMMEPRIERCVKSFTYGNQLQPGDLVYLVEIGIVRRVINPCHYNAFQRYILLTE